MGSNFWNIYHQGQICMMIKRFIICKNKYDEFVEKFVVREKELIYEDAQQLTDHLT